MTYTAAQWRAAVTKLLEMTSRNEVIWEPSNLYGGEAGSEVDSSLMAAHDNKLYVVSKIRNRYYIDEDEYVWRGGMNFSIYEKNIFGQFQHIATAPDISSLSLLYVAAENNMAFNRNALGGLLG